MPGNLPPLSVRMRTMRGNPRYASGDNGLLSRHQVSLLSEKEATMTRDVTYRRERELPS